MKNENTHIGGYGWADRRIKQVTLNKVLKHGYL